MPVLRIRDKNGNFVPLNAIRGARGKSAYEQAIEGGYKGSEKEFIALLNGMDEHYSDFDNPHKVTAEQAGAASQEQFDLLESNFLRHVNEEAVALDEEIGNLKLGVQRLDGEVTSQAGSLMACTTAISQLETNVSENKPVLLWENASPTSLFAEQTIEIDFSHYRKIEIVCDTAAGGNFVEVSRIISVGNTTELYNCWGGLMTARRFTCQVNGLSVSDAKTFSFGSSSIATDNNYLIPMCISGIKKTEVD